MSVRIAAPPIPVPAAVPVVIVIPPFPMERVAIAVTPITTNVASVIEPVTITPFAGPIAVVAVALAIARPGAVTPTLIVTIAVAAAREISTSIGTITVATIEITVASNVADSAPIQIATAVKVARAIARVAASLIKPPRYVSTTRRVTIAAERTVATEAVTIAHIGLTLRRIAPHLEEVANFILARTTGLILLAALVAAIKLATAAQIRPLTARTSGATKLAGFAARLIAQRAR
jgi:hypothetical protein